MSLSIKSRRVIFAIFFGAFLISAPIVVLRTAGFTFNFTKFKFVRTGAISVSTIPKDANIYVDNNVQKTTTPAFIKNLIPAEYSFKLSKDGYYDWEKIIEVKSQTTTFVEKIILFSKSQPEDILNKDVILASFDPMAQTLAYLIKTDSWLELRSFDLSTKAETLLKQYKKTSFLKPKIFWSSDGSYLILSDNESPKKEFAIISKDGKDDVEIQKITQSKINDIYWHPNFERVLFIVSREGTYSYRIASKISEKLSSEPVLATLLNGKTIFIITDKEKTTIMQSGPDKIERAIALLPIGNYEFLPATEPYVLLHEKIKKRVILIDTGDADQPILLNAEAKIAKWDPQESKKLLYASEFEIHLFNPETLADELLTRLGEAISDISWHPAGSNVFLSGKNMIESIELDPRQKRNITEIVSGVASAFNLLTDSKAQKIYYTTKNDSGQRAYGLTLSLE